MALTVVGNYGDFDKKAPVGYFYYIWSNNDLILDK